MYFVIVFCFLWLYKLVEAGSKLSKIVQMANKDAKKRLMEPEWWVFGNNFVIFAGCGRDCREEKQDVEN